MASSLVVFALAFFSASAFASVPASPAKRALIYRGPGDCRPDDCVAAAANIASLAGLTPTYVGPTDDDPAKFLDAAVWIQPGGRSDTVGENMLESLKDRIRAFVRAGGAYVGFCAGSYYATQPAPGLKFLGLINADAELYDAVPYVGQLMSVSWRGHGNRTLYWEGGNVLLPRAPLPGDGATTVVSRYPDGRINALYAEVGSGRVALVGTHPEAPAWWRDDLPTTDADGLDWDLGVEMVRWAIRR